MRVKVGVGLVCSLGLVFLGSAFGATRYVNATNATPGAPYASWGFAATNIQQAIDASNTGDEILVAPGVYRVAETIGIPPSRTLTVRSTQSRAAVIDAQGLCTALDIQGTNSVVEGFTIRNGVSPGYGGGIVMSVASTVRDCLVTSNRAYGGAGIVLHKPGLVENCTIQSNLATFWAGGVLFYNHSSGTVNRCFIMDNVASNYAGGVAFQYEGTVSNSWISGNHAVLEKAGGVEMALGGRLVNSVVVGNGAHTEAGGIYNFYGYVAHCTVMSNTAGKGGGMYGGNSATWNSIIYYNTAPTNADVMWDSGIISNCCTSTNMGGSNFTNAPAFVDFAGRDFHLAAGSSCIERGATNPAVQIDYDGVSRPQLATLAGSPSYDVGAFEYRMFWDAGYADIGSGWRRLNWFGDYTPMGAAGWNWHNKHGFLYAAPTSYEYDIWFYTQDMGWLWTSRTKYPFLYRSSDGAWLWYNGATNPRWFRNMTAGTWEHRP